MMKLNIDIFLKMFSEYSGLLFVFLFIILFLWAFPAGGYSRLYRYQDLLESAYEKNKELLQLKIEEKQALTGIAGARSELYPKLNYEISMNYLDNYYQLPTIDAGVFGEYEIAGEEIIIPQETIDFTSSMDDYFYRFKITMDQPVYTWGKLNKAVDLSREVWLIRNLAYKKKKYQIRTALKINLTALFYLQEIEEMILKQKALSERMVSITEQSYENGFLIKSDVLNAKIQAKEINLASFQIIEQKRQALLMLEKTTGLKNVAIFDIDFSDLNTNLQNGKIQSKTDLLEKVNENSLDIRMLEKMKSIAEQKLEIEKSKAGFRPDIGLHIEYSYGGPRFPFLEMGWYGEDDYQMTFSLGLQSTFYDGGGGKADLKLTEQELESASLSIDQGLSEVENYIEEIRIKISLNKDRLEYYQLRQENDLQQISMKEAQYEIGSANETDLLKAKINYYKDMISFYQELISFYRNYYSLMSVLYEEESVSD